MESIVLKNFMTTFIHVANETVRKNTLLIYVGFVMISHFEKPIESTQTMACTHNPVRFSLTEFVLAFFYRKRSPSCIQQSVVNQVFHLFACAKGIVSMRSVF